jgi:exodeoxyribonuclease V alpha subunit
MTFALDPSQQKAVELTCSAPCGIVTGGPGTGKSTCLKYALDRLDRSHQRYELAAPTGKAAKRMHETTGREARTIHRLLEFRPGQGFGRCRGNPLETDVVVIDESSMVDVELGAALFGAVDPSRTRVILIGDANQLPPVGPGRVFGDLVDSAMVPIAQLQTLHRSAQQSWIHLNAPRVLAGQLPELAPRADFRFVEIDSAKDVLPEVRRLLTDVVPREINATAQLLIPQKPGVAGIDEANRVLQRALNPRPADEPSIGRDKHPLHIGDRVIQVKNDYQLGVFNGEIGEISEIGGGVVVVQFEGREPVRYSLDQAGGLQLSYALTVHRAQGSEFPWVICVVHSTHSFMLTRQLVYTAITRGKQGVILVGDKKGLKTALADKKPPRRNTALIERLRGELGGAP